MSHRGLVNSFPASGGSARTARSGDSSHLLTKDPNCRFTGYRHPTALPDGRLGFEQVCKLVVADRRIEQATGQTADSRGLWAYGWETGATARLVAASAALSSSTVHLEESGDDPRAACRRRHHLRQPSLDHTRLAWNSRRASPCGLVQGIGSLDEHLRHWSRPCTEESRASWPAWSPDGQTDRLLGLPAVNWTVEGAARLDQLWNLYLMNPENAQPRCSDGSGQRPGPSRPGLVARRPVAGVCGRNAWISGRNCGWYTPGISKVPHLRLVARWEHLQSPTWSPDGQQLIVIESNLSSLPCPCFGHTRLTGPGRNCCYST